MQNAIRNSAPAARANSPAAQGCKRRRLVRVGSILGLGAVLMGLAACTGARVANVTSVNAGGAAPFEILVDVDAALPADNSQAKLAGEVAGKLKAALIQRLTEAHVTAEPFVPGTRHPGAAVLHVSIVEADPGNRLKRLVIGFGAGHAELQAKADLVSTDDRNASSLTAFDTAGDSGRQPGLILPAGVALATRNLVHLAIGGGIKLALSLNDGLDKPIQGTSKAVVEQLSKYYGAVGWRWPASQA